MRLSISFALLISAPTFAVSQEASPRPARQSTTNSLFKRLADVQRDFSVALGADTTQITVSPAGIAGFPPMSYDAFYRDMGITRH
jgi:hypothetical protein